jgi:NAD+ diphosphatase
MHTPAGFEPGLVAPDALPATAHAFAFRGDRILVVARNDDDLVIPDAHALGEAAIAGTPHFLGNLEGVPCVAYDLAETQDEPGGMRYLGLRSLFLKVPDPLLALAARAFQIVDFDRTHRYCGRCGTATQRKQGERARECPACGLVAYPRVSPAMMALVTRGKEVLLARSHRFATGVYSALAGFVEPGETIEDCVRREVREEVGVEVDNIEYFASQSWAFPHSLMIAYTAQYAGGDIRLEDAEIAEARWFSIDALPKLPSSISIARRLIDATVEKLRSA